MPNHDHDFRLIFTGVMGRDRGLEFVIEALPRLLCLIPHLRLVLVGDGPLLPMLKKLAQCLHVESSLDFVGWVGHHEVYRLINEADIGLIPHPVSEHIATTMPNKIYDYMLMGRPIVCTDAPPLARLVKAVNCGLSYTSGAKDDFIAKVYALYKDPSYRHQLGDNGRHAVLARYNWSVDGHAFLQCVHETASKGRAAD